MSVATSIIIITFVTADGVVARAVKVANTASHWPLLAH